MAVSPTRTRLSALILLTAILPMLLYVGHWRALASGGATMSAAQHAHEHEGGQDHSQHCHGAVEGCASGEVGSASVSLARTSLALDVTLTEGAQPPPTERLPSGWSIAPTPPPPQSPFL